MYDHFTAWLVELLKRTWISVLLVTGLVLLLVFSLDNAHWVPDDLPLLICIYLGALCGLLLAASRFQAGLAAGYALLLGLATLVQAIGRVIPTTENLSLLDSLWLAHARLLSFYERLSGWATAIHNGQTIHDTGLFIFLIGLLVWNASAWLLWTVFRRRQAWLGMLPYGLLLAINVHLNRQDNMFLAIFAALALLLAANTTFIVQNQDWDVRRVDYPSELGWEWSFVSAALALAVGLTAWFAPLVASPEGWQVLRRMVQVTQLHVANTADQLFSGVTPPRSYAPVVTAQNVNLEQIGSAPSQLQDTIMWVQVSTPPSEAPSYERQVQPYYWRSQIFSTYTGSGWQPAARQPYLAENLPPGQAPPGRYLLKQHFEIVVPHTRQLFSVNQPVQASPGIDMTATSPDKSLLLQGDISEYDVTSFATLVSGNELNSASVIYPQVISQVYLQLPASLPGRVRSLAHQITAGASTPYEKAIRIQNYLRLTYPYNNNEGPPPPGWDAVDYFLFEAQGGFCSYYATAMAVMLRAEGVPARVATGYARGAFNDVQNAYRVAALSAHAWVEVYFPGYDWIEFEPTPTQPAVDYALTDGTAPVNPPSPAASVVQSFWKQIPPRLDGVVVALALFVIAGMFLLFWQFVGRSVWLNGYAKFQGGQSTALYLRLRQALSWAGLGAPLYTTPLEFLNMHTAALARYQLLYEAIEQATSLYQRSLFSSHPPTQAELQAAQHCWVQAVPQWLKLWITHLAARSAQLHV